MKTRVNMLVLLLLAFLSTSVVQGTSFSEFTGFGSREEAITQWGVPNSMDMVVTVFQRTAPSGFIRELVLGPIQTLEDFPRLNKVQIDELLRLKLHSVTEKLLTLDGIDKNKVFGIRAYTTRNNERLPDQIYLYHQTEFFLSKSSDGTYNIPDFSDREFGLPSSMFFEVPGLEWGRIEISDNHKVYPFDDPRLFWETDTRLDPQDPPTGIFLEDEYVMIRTDWAISGTNGATLIKVFLGTHEGSEHKYNAYGPLGKRITLPSFKSTSPAVAEGVISFDITGGGPGQVIMVQCAADPAGPWIDTGEQLVVRRYGMALNYQKYIYGPFGFHRIRTVNAKPFWQ